MKKPEPSMRRAETYEELIPLIEFCKAGKLFEAQDWISAGKPLNLPFPFKRKAWQRSPLRIAMESGFHSLIKVLVEAGAVSEDSYHSPLEQAVAKRRLDLVDLLVKNGAAITSVDMAAVFEAWNPEIVDYFIVRGADLETGCPLASALCAKIRPALGLFRRYREKVSTFQEQANIALRHHCWHGSLKWIALMLWAGADPYARGPTEPGDDPDPEEDRTALEIAALFGRSEVFKMKTLRIDPSHPEADSLLRSACHPKDSTILEILLEKGFDPIKMEDKGSSSIAGILSSMSWDWDYNPFTSYSARQRKNLDPYSSREKMKMLHLLVRHGARWEPKDRGEIDSARSCLLKMIPDYTAEFVWIMTGYKACSVDALEQLLRTPSIRTLVSNQLPRITEMIDTFKKSLGSAQEENQCTPV